MGPAALPQAGAANATLPAAPLCAEDCRGQACDPELQQDSQGPLGVRGPLPQGMASAGEFLDGASLVISRLQTEGTFF